MRTHLECIVLCIAIVFVTVLIEGGRAHASVDDHSESIYHAKDTFVEIEGITSNLAEKMESLKRQVSDMAMALEIKTKESKEKDMALTELRTQLEECRGGWNPPQDASDQGQQEPRSRADAVLSCVAKPEDGLDSISLHRDQPGGVNCSTKTHKRVDGGVLRSISPACFAFPLLDVHMWHSGISSATCKRLIELAETANSWTEKSALGFKTWDVGVDVLALEENEMVEIESFVKRLAKFISSAFVPRWKKVDGLVGSSQRRKIKYSEVPVLKGNPFVIRYEAGGESAGISRHKDNADVSFIVLLSDPSEFVGGGTVFDAIDENLQLQQGEALVSSG